MYQNNNPGQPDTFVNLVLRPDSPDIPVIFEHWYYRFNDKVMRCVVDRREQSIEDIVNRFIRLND